MRLSNANSISYLRARECNESLPHSFPIRLKSARGGGQGISLTPKYICTKRAGGDGRCAYFLRVSYQTHGTRELIEWIVNVAPGYRGMSTILPNARIAAVYYILQFKSRKCRISVSRPRIFVYVHINVVQYSLARIIHICASIERKSHLNAAAFRREAININQQIQEYIELISIRLDLNWFQRTQGVCVRSNSGVPHVHTHTREEKTCSIRMCVCSCVESVKCKKNIQYAIDVNNICDPFDEGSFLEWFAVDDCNWI